MLQPFSRLERFDIMAGLKASSPRPMGLCLLKTIYSYQRDHSPKTNIFFPDFGRTVLFSDTSVGTWYEKGQTTSKSKFTKHLLVHTHQIKQDADNAMALRWEVKIADASGECRGGGHLSTALLSEEATAAASRRSLVVRRRVGGDCLASQLRTLRLLRHVSSLHGHARRETSVGGGGVSAPGARGNAGVSLFN